MSYPLPPPPLPPHPQLNSSASSTSSFIPLQTQLSINNNNNQNSNNSTAAASATTNTISTTVTKFFTHKSIQTEITTTEMLDSASAIQSQTTRIDELLKDKDDLHKELMQLKKDLDKQIGSFRKCLNVNKKLLMEKSTLEKKQARQKCMENRLRLGQFVTQRQGATFVENWVDGYAFNDIMKQQELMNNAKEELDKERKLLAKKRPQIEKEAGIGGGGSSKTNKETKSSSSSKSGTLLLKIFFFFYLDSISKNKMSRLSIWS
jgi:tousled-like kinase